MNDIKTINYLNKKKLFCIFNKKYDFSINYLLNFLKKYNINYIDNIILFNKKIIFIKHDINLIYLIFFKMGEGNFNFYFINFLKKNLIKNCNLLLINNNLISLNQKKINFFYYKNNYCDFFIIKKILTNITLNFKKKNYLIKNNTFIIIQVYKNYFYIKKIKSNNFLIRTKIFLKFNKNVFICINSKYLKNFLTQNKQISIYYSVNNKIVIFKKKFEIYFKAIGYI
ncbi:hypothetical protein V7Z36_01175 [Candidatus Carsonella ruddii]|uniref:Uncharacterized protein n=1 Tax=Carsonella ruddii TaxID=114186 RepID=A0AAE7G4B4_CARRU|nr:hypothetical protein [Candidatus Carsonella ruddii]QLK14170.1 hypothetical protein FK493_01130 [Candidatus Carsonella ruddii]